MALIQVNNFASTGGGNATRSSLFLTMLFKNFLTYLYFYFRPFIKWFLRRFTRLCELQRICYGSPAGAARTRQVEMSLQLTRRREIREMMNILDNEVEHCSEYELRELVKKMVMTVMMAKKIKPRNHPDFARLFGECVEQIWGYRRLICIVEAIRTDQYDPDNLNNEKKLFQLWSLLMPDDRLESRITKQWQDIGFQVSILFGRTNKVHLNPFLNSRAMTPRQISEEWAYSDLKTCSSSPVSTTALRATFSRTRTTPTMATRSLLSESISLPWPTDSSKRARRRPTSTI